MNTTEIIKQLARQSSITQAKAKQLLKLHTDNLAQHLAQGDQLILRGFGSFKVMQQPARKVWNPAKKRFQTSTERNNIHFKASPKMTSWLNQNNGS